MLEEIRSKPNHSQQTQLALDPLDLEIGEMIFDETITKVGRDFYDEFL